MCCGVQVPRQTASVAIEVLRTCTERHSKGLMSPALLTVLSHRQLALPGLLEDEAHRELPDIHRLFRPVRQNVYAILFNMHHHHFMANRAKGESVPLTPGNYALLFQQTPKWVLVVIPKTNFP